MESRALRFAVMLANVYYVYTRTRIWTIKPRQFELSHLRESTPHTHTLVAGWWKIFLWKLNFRTTQTILAARLGRRRVWHNSRRLFYTFERRHQTLLYMSPRRQANTRRNDDDVDAQYMAFPTRGLGEMIWFWNKALYVATLEREMLVKTNNSI